MALRDVVKMGNPLLRKRSVEVSADELQDDKLQQLIDDMIDTMRDSNGAGIAAPQIGALTRVFIMEMMDNPRYPNKPTFPLTIALNPKIIIISEDKIQSWEGCLSIPGIRGRLPRYATVQLDAWDRDGQPYSKVLTGFEAVVAQHELDHLDGILLIDRMESMETLSFQDEYERYWL